MSTAAKPKRPKPKVIVPRLPPDSQKHTLWTGTQWQGEFHVLGQTFRAFAKSEMKLFWDLDGQYRRWLAAQSDEVKAKHTAHLN